MECYICKLNLSTSNRVRVMYMNENCDVLLCNNCYVRFNGDEDDDEDEDEDNGDNVGEEDDSSSISIESVIQCIHCGILLLQMTEGSEERDYLTTRDYICSACSSQYDN